MKIRNYGPRQKFKCVLYKKILNNDKNSILQQQNKFEDIGTEFMAEILEGDFKQQALEEIGIGIKTTGETLVIKTNYNLDFKMNDFIDVVGISTGLIQSSSKPIVSYLQAGRRKTKDIYWILVIS